MCGECNWPIDKKSHIMKIKQKLTEKLRNELKFYIEFNENADNSKIVEIKEESEIHGMD